MRCVYEIHSYYIFYSLSKTININHNAPNSYPFKCSVFFFNFIFCFFFFIRSIYAYFVFARCKLLIFLFLLAHTFDDSSTQTHTFNKSIKPKQSKSSNCLVTNTHLSLYMPQLMKASFVKTKSKRRRKSLCSFAVVTVVHRMYRRVFS